MLTKDANLQDIPRFFDLRKLGYRESFVELAHSGGRSHAWDALLLAGPPPATTDPRIVTALTGLDDAFARDQSGVAAKVGALGVKGAQLEEALTQYTLLEVRHELFRAATQCGISPGALGDFMIAEPHRVLSMLPSRQVVHSMYMQHAQPQKVWKPNDLHDIAALGVAVPYCDAVATERHWVSRLRRRKLDAEYNTAIIASTAELVEYLARL